MTHRHGYPWTSKEVERLEQARSAGLRLSDMATLLGRTQKSCQVMLTRLGLTRPCRKLEDHEQRIRTLYEQGYSMHAIAVRLKIPRRTMHAWGKILGLAPHGHSQSRFLQRMRALYRQRQARGMSPERARSDHQRLRAARLGWPQADSPRQANILTLLLSGPKTTTEMAEHLGLSGCEQTYLALGGLRRAGLVQSRRRLCQPRRPWEYVLADGVRPHPCVNRNEKGA